MESFSQYFSTPFRDRASTAVMYDPEDEWDVRESISKEEVPVSFCLERSYAYLYGLLGGGVLLSL